MLCSVLSLQFRRIIPLLSLCTAVVVSSPVIAGTDSTSFSVTATVEDSCAVSATDLGFGSYDPIAGSNLDASSAVTAKCTDGTGYTIGLDAGTGGGATTDNRLMTLGGGTDTLSYDLYQDSARTTLWKELGSGSTVSATGNGMEQTHGVYGRIPSGQNSAVPGSYSDTITVTISY